MPDDVTTDTSGPEAASAAGVTGVARVPRVTLAVLAAGGAALGLNAAFAPRSFYDDFPFGRGWVAADGPYNEHLVRDFGAQTLALTVVTVAIVIAGNRITRLGASLAWLAFSAIHFAYHLRHLDPYDGIDKAGNVVSLALLTALPLIAIGGDLWPRGRRELSGPADRAPRPGAPRPGSLDGGHGP